MRQKLTLDFTGVKYALQFYEVVIESLEFPAPCGMNYDAIWDCMRDYCSETHVVVRGTSTLSGELAEAAKEVIDIFREASEKISKFSYVVED
jgi:RNAse (barnase) inhibitor barstar